MMFELEKTWKEKLNSELEKEYYQNLMQFLEEEYTTQEIFPPKEQVLSAFEITPFENVKVVIIGQDPYHDFNQAHGLCFSVNEGVAIPPSLANIYREIHDDLGLEIPKSGNLKKWAK